MINVRQKGASGEQEICKALNEVVERVRARLGLPPSPAGKPIVQRNSNQSAVGGCDLVGTFDLAVEVKRQEQLAINNWWAQCVASAEHLGHTPVLLFRQNAKPGTRTVWRCILNVEIPTHAPVAPFVVRAEVSFADFLLWFERWVELKYKDELNMVDEPAFTVEIGKPALFCELDDTVQEAPTRILHPSLFEEEAHV